MSGQDYNKCWRKVLINDVSTNAVRRLEQDRVEVHKYKWIKLVLLELETDKHFVPWRLSSHWEVHFWGKNVPDDQDQPQRQTRNTVLWKNTLSFRYRCNRTCFLSYVKWPNFSFYHLQIKSTWWFYFCIAY